MNIACIILGIIFIICSIIFFFGGINLFSKTWKNMPQEEKDKINIGPLARNIGFVGFLAGILFLLGGILPTFRENWFNLSIIIWLVLAALDVVYINKSKRYKKSKK